MEPETAFPLVIDAIASTDFFRDAHRRIYTACLDLREDGVAIDLVTLKERLGEQLGEVGGPVYLGSLVDGVPRSTNVAHYAEIVVELRRRRELVFVGNKIANAGYDGMEASNRLLDDSDRWIQELRTGVSHDDLIDPALSAMKFMDAIEDRLQRKNELLGVSTGFPQVDALTCGLVGGELIILAAGTGEGKTVLAVQLALTVAKMKKPVLYVSMEMPAGQLEYRIASAESKVEMFKIRKGWLTQNELERVTLAIAQRAAYPFYIDDTSGMTVARLRSRARRLAAMPAGLGLVVVDYLQLMDADHRGGGDRNRATEVGEFSRGLKLLAGELNVPVLALSQLSRKSKEQKRRPELSDLRESGSIEQDADMVWFIYLPHQDKIEAELIIKKQRNGPAPETVNLEFHKPIVTFYEASLPPLPLPSQEALL